MISAGTDLHFGAKATHGLSVRYQTRVCVTCEAVVLRGVSRLGRVRSTICDYYIACDA